MLENQKPLDASAYMATLNRLDKSDPLGCDAYFDVRYASGRVSDTTAHATFSLRSGDAQ